MYFQIIDGELFLSDPEKLIRKKVCNGNNFREHESYFRNDTPDGSTLVLKCSDSSVVIRENVKITGYTMGVGIIFQNRDSFYLWNFYTREETNIGSWREECFYMRKIGTQKLALVANLRSLVKIEFLSYTKFHSRDCFDYVIFKVSRDRYRIFNFCGGEVEKNYFLSTIEGVSSFFVRQNDLLYKKVLEIKSDIEKIANNAFVRSDGKICTLYALEGETLKKLYSASQEEWNKIFECSSQEVKILLADGKAMCWEIKKEELGCNPMVVNIRQEQPQTQVKQRRNPWWKFWLS